MINALDNHRAAHVAGAADGELHHQDAQGRITIAEVEDLVEVGEIEPDSVHTPAIYVQRIFQASNYEKRIERRTVRKRGAE